MSRCLLLFILMLVALPAAAMDDIQAVNAVWGDFVASLRRGDYRRAHSLFSLESQAALPYAEFVREYGPLSAAREMVLLPAESQVATVRQDWAELSVSGGNPGTGKQFKVGVALVRNAAHWGLVAARNEATERMEVEARAILQLLDQAREQKSPEDLLAALNQTQAGSPVLQAYRFEVIGTVFQAHARQKELRSFVLDHTGTVVVFGSAGLAKPPVAATNAAASRQEIAAEKNIHPQMTAAMVESLPQQRSRPPETELAEPPMRFSPPQREQRRGVGEPTHPVGLPESIR